MLILECSQGCDGRTDGRKDDGGITISLCNFVGEGIIKVTTWTGLKVLLPYMYSAWLIVFKGQVNIYFSAILFWQKQVTFDEMMMSYVY